MNKISFIFDLLQPVFVPWNIIPVIVLTFRLCIRWLDKVVVLELVKFVYSPSVRQLLCKLPVTPVSSCLVRVDQDF